MDEFSTLQKITVWVIPVLFAITVHEVAHGWVASRLGDMTAKMQGRLTLNPFKHIDPVGTVLIPAVTMLLAGFIFGYAKPVPVTYQNLRHPKRDMAIVALAGPSSNLLMALLWILWIKIAISMSSQFPSMTLFMIATGVAGIFVNLILMVLNMLPLPPLDGGRVLTGVLPMPYSAYVARLEPYGFMILIALLLLGVLGKILWPVIIFFLLGFTHFAGISTNDLSVILHAIGAMGA
jgi:Zn-dependent protease